MAHGHGSRVSVWGRQHGNNNSAFQSFTVGSLGCGSHMQVGRSYAHPGTPVEFPFFWVMMVHDYFKSEEDVFLC